MLSTAKLTWSKKKEKSRMLKTKKSVIVLKLLKTMIWTPTSILLTHRRIHG